MRRNAIRRFIADGWGVVLGATVSIITARTLGPAGRGVFSTIGFVSGFVAALSVLGLGEALIIAIGRRRTTAQEGIGTVVVAVLAVAGVLAIAMSIAAFLLASGEKHRVLIAILAAVPIPLGALTTVLSYGLNSKERFAAPTAVIVITPSVICVLMVILLLGLRLEIVGAFAALVGASAVALAVVGITSRRAGLTTISFDRALLRDLLPNSLRLVASSSVTMLTAQLDLLFVFLLAGKAPAGRYSIALTASALSGTAANALAYACFPQLAYSDRERWKVLSDRVMQLTMVSALLSAAAIAVVAPFLIPLAYGARFSGAVVPTLILLVGALFSSVHWVLARIVSARGLPQIPLKAYTVSLITMCSADFVLIPPLGASGAGIAVVASGAVGVYVMVRSMRATDTELAGLSLRLRPQSFRELTRLRAPVAD